MYSCLSPNRFPVTLEPHFRLPLFGLWPKRLRNVVLPLVRGVTSEKGTDLRSLRQIKRYFGGVDPSRRSTFFLAPKLESTVRQTPARRLIMAAISNAVSRPITYWLANRLLLPIAPYHLTVVLGGNTA